MQSCKCKQAAWVATSPTAAVRPRATAVKVSMRTPAETIATHRQPESTHVPQEPVAAGYRASETAQEDSAWQRQTAVVVESAETAELRGSSANATQQIQQTVSAAASKATSASAQQQSAAMQEHGPWQLPPQLQGLLTGPCLVAAGALACSFISLQVKLFDHHVPPLEVSACSSAVAWLATSFILGEQQWHRLHPPQQQQQQHAGVLQPGAQPQAAAASLAPISIPDAAAALGASKPGSTPSTSSLLLLRGLLGAATVTAYYAAVEELPLSVAVAIFFFHPVLALLLNSSVSGTRVSAQAAGSCALTVLGVLVIGWHDHLMVHLEQAAAFLEVLGTEGFAGATAAAAAAGSDVILGPELSLYGVLMGLIAAASNAAAFVVVGLIGKDVSPLNVCWWQYCVTTHAAVAVLLLSQVETVVVQAAAASGLELTASSALGLSIGSLGVDRGFFRYIVQDSFVLMQDALPSQHDALLLSGVVIANFAGQLLLNAGFQRIDAGRGAAVNTLQVLFANVWDVLLLQSQPSGGVLMGSGMIAAGVIGTRQSAAGEQQQKQQGHVSHATGGDEAGGSSSSSSSSS